MLDHAICAAPTCNIPMRRHGFAGMSGCVMHSCLVQMHLHAPCRATSGHCMTCYMPPCSDAKLCVLDWDEAEHRLRISSLHYLEKDPLIREARAVQVLLTARNAHVAWWQNAWCRGVRRGYRFCMLGGPSQHVAVHACWCVGREIQLIVWRMYCHACTTAVMTTWWGPGFGSPRAPKSACGQHSALVRRPRSRNSFPSCHVVQVLPPRVIADPMGRCAAVLCFDHQLALLPAMEVSVLPMGRVL